MKKAKLELTAQDAVTIYRALGREEEAIKGDKEASPAVLAMSLAHLNGLKDRVAIIYERTRPLPSKQKGQRT